MPEVIDAAVTGRSDTDASDPLRNSEDFACDLERTKRSLFVNIPSTTFTVTFVPSHGVQLESGGGWERPTSGHERADLSKALVDAWASIGKERSVFTEQLHRLTGATTATSTTVSSAASLLRYHHRDERLRRMSPDARATYDRIRKLREEIGPLDFDIVKALRELRDDG